MPIFAFTFGSFGEIASTLQLAWAIRQSLSETGGAVALVQTLISDIDTFTRALQKIRSALEARGSVPADLMNGIALALGQCFHLLLRVKQRIDAYNSRMTGAVGVALSRRYWAVIACEILGGEREMETFQATLIEHVKIVEALLTSSALSRLDVTRDISAVPTRPDGHGASTDVHRGILQREGSSIEVALKISRKQNRDFTQRTKEKWLYEIMIWSELSHPNVVKLFGLCWKPWEDFSALQLPASVSSWCSHGTINQYLKSQTAGTPRKLELLSQLLEGLKYLHDRNIVHADIKGDNILVSDDEVACIADFGLSALSDEHLARTHTSIGTTRWMAPELFHDHARATLASDIWAVGGVIHEIVTGTYPYSTLKTEQQVILRLTKGQPPERPHDFPDIFWNIATLCWQVEPARRPTTIALLDLLKSL